MTAQSPSRRPERRPERHPGGAGPRHKTADTASFGFREVPVAQKPRLVRGVFESVASRYDLMNDLMSGGLHRLWKAAMIDWLNPRPGTSLIDLAGGTGDIAVRAIARLGRARYGRVVICDLTPAMLDRGRDRFLDRGILSDPERGPHWVCGDATGLPFPDSSSDAVTIAFGLRNVADIDAALRECRRVLRPGGRFLCLEFSRVATPLLSELYDLYSFRAIPALGAAVARDAGSYRYLVESIRRFPPREELRARLREAGFEQVRDRGLSGGIAALHSGWRL